MKLSCLINPKTALENADVYVRVKNEEGNLISGSITTVSNHIDDNKIELIIELNKPEDDDE